MTGIGNHPVQAVLFDFDGTISTLREGWERVMEPMMTELISGGKAPSRELVRRVRAYIDESTGVQTVYQMQWLMRQVKDAGFHTEDRDVWWYKDRYNRLLLEQVNGRILRLKQKIEPPENYLIEGSVCFLSALRSLGISIYIASGTDDADLQNEINILGVRPFVTLSKGAPHRETDCSKEAVIKSLLETLDPQGLAVIGDGKVEITLGRASGARTIGMAADEKARRGINPVKEKRLRGAGADMIAGDFLGQRELLSFLGVPAGALI